MSVAPLAFAGDAVPVCVASFFARVHGGPGVVDAGDLLGRALESRSRVTLDATAAGGHVRALHRSRGQVG